LGIKGFSQTRQTKSISIRLFEIEATTNLIKCTWFFVQIRYVIPIKRTKSSVHTSFTWIYDIIVFN